MKQAPRSWAARLAALALLLGPGVAAPAEPGAELRLIEALERAPGLVLGSVRDVTRLPHSGYSAALAVEQTLRGAAPANGTALLAWEEPAPSLPPRLEGGLRVLATISPLPTASIWKTRIPDDAERMRTSALGGAGDGYLVRPNGFELNALEHYLALDLSAREGDAGVLHLSRMAANAQVRLARACIARLATLPDLDAHITDAASAALVEALLRDREGGVGTALLGLVESRQPAALRTPLAARIDAEGAVAPAILQTALAFVDAEMPEQRAIALLDADDADRRLAAVPWARGAPATRRLQDLSRRDPDPRVRAAALERLRALEAERALPELLDALDDPAPLVRRASAEALAALGPTAIPALRQEADAASGETARTAIAALALMGEPARADLEEIASLHPDPGIRTLATIALGQPIGHRD